MTSLNWIVGKDAYRCRVEPGACPMCLQVDVVVALPPPLLAQQPDNTTHVCHPGLGGCNHGFTKTEAEGR